MLVNPHRLILESPFLRFVNTLSPIKPVKASHATQGFLGLNSPPLVFKSSRISAPHHETQYSERSCCLYSISIMLI
ncbi:cysteine-rich polycomb-like protein, putative [Medicago truncatula]|uniref:Cysteine-rich polycomb-like protein, putative n=1 Tax=Medicago truncatula TaxID=3880 RepID=G7I6E9_MEDTR|nr:cysteine-rich polycomb-like protein, putative [Medicago truncatula]